MIEKRSISIAGAGLTGTLLSIYLSDLGFDVEVFEKRPDPLVTRPEEGRSINLALSHRGIKALEVAGIAGEVLKLTIPMKGRMVHEQNGSLKFLPYGQPGQHIYSVSRADLNRILMSKARASGRVAFHFNTPVVSVDLKRNQLLLEQEGKRRESGFEILFAADGANSAVRDSLSRSGSISFRKEMLEHGYKELHIEGDRGKHRIDPNALHIWPREKFMLIALPNTDGSFTCTLFLPFKGRNSFEEISNGTAAKSFFREFFPDALDLISDLEGQFEQNPLSSLFLVHADTWAPKENILLVGDAAHAIVPFYGQGMNAGFESCRILREMILSGKDRESLFPNFGALRKPDTDAIGELALENFSEMRDKVADPEFLLQKRLETLISRRYPEKYIPLYSMVTFSDLPYSEALKRGRKQQELIREILEDNDVREAPESPVSWIKINEKVKAFFGSGSY